jgi:hypothetical protein
MPEKTVKRRLQDCDAALASDDGPTLRLTLTWRGGQYEPAGLHLSEYFDHQPVDPSNKRSRSDEVSSN